MIFLVHLNLNLIIYNVHFYTDSQMLPFSKLKYVLIQTSFFLKLFTVPDLHYFKSILKALRLKTRSGSDKDLNQYN